MTEVSADYGLSAPADPPDEPMPNPRWHDNTMMGLRDQGLANVTLKADLGPSVGKPFPDPGRHERTSRRQREMNVFEAQLTDGVVAALDTAAQWILDAVVDAYGIEEYDEPDPDERRDRER